MERETEMKRSLRCELNKLENKDGFILEVILEYNFVLFLNYQRLLTN